MKDELISQIRAGMMLRLGQLRQAATDPGSKAESKYDTRSLEASYLAVGQARQVEELARALRHFESFHPPSFGAGEAIAAGALVELRTPGGRAWFFLAPAGGGLEVSIGQDTITLLSPESPLYQNLLGCRVGDVLDHPVATVMALR